MRTVGIIQPNYIPWRGYFDFIRKTDVFVFLDDVQYTKQDWRNRNRICARVGNPVWLTVPVFRTKLDQLILDVQIDYKTPWVKKHLLTIGQHYAKAPYFSNYMDGFTEILEQKHTHLSDLDIALTRKICSWLGVDVEFQKSSELASLGRKDEKLIDLVKTVGGDRYLSGPAAKAYIQPDCWKEAGIDLAFMSYPEYPQYPQINPGFEPQVSVLDLLFMVGPDAPKYIWGET